MTVCPGHSLLPVTVASPLTFECVRSLSFENHFPEKLLSRFFKILNAAWPSVCSYSVFSMTHLIFHLWGDCMDCDFTKILQTYGSPTEVVVLPVCSTESCCHTNLSVRILCCGSTCPCQGYLTWSNAHEHWKYFCFFIKFTLVYRIHILLTVASVICLV